MVELSAGNLFFIEFLANNTADSRDKEMSDKYVSNKERPTNNIIYLALLMFLNALINSFYNVPAKVSGTSLDSNPIFMLLSLEA